MRPPRHPPEPHPIGSPRALCVLTTLLVAGCGGDDLETGPDDPGAVEVTVATTGASLDPDGYQVLLDTTSAATVAANGSVILPQVAPGSHQVGLAPASLAPNCRVAEPNPRPATITSGDTARVAFSVACGALGSPPAITAVEGPTVADNVPGTVTTFTVGFADPDADVAQLVVVAESDPYDAVSPDSVTVDVRQRAGGQATGAVSHAFTCGAIPPDFCGAGPVTLRFGLRDAEGAASEPRRYRVEFGIGRSPRLTAVVAPTQSSTARGARTRISLGFVDPDGDLNFVRVREISDPGDALEADGATIDAASQAGGDTSGTIDIDYVCQAQLGRSCRTGTATLSFVLVDTAGNTSAPGEATIAFQATIGAGTAPSITRFEGPTQISTASGSVGVFLFGFADPDGDVTTLRIAEASDPSSAFPGDVDVDVLPQTAGLDSGQVRMELRCNAAPGTECTAGRVGFRFSLQDSQRNDGPTVEHEVEFVSPGGGEPTTTRWSMLASWSDAPSNGRAAAAGNAKNPRGEAPRVLRR
jgi:hypothetical protein